MHIEPQSHPSDSEPSESEPAESEPTVRAAREVFVIGISGAVGRLLARRLLTDGVLVRGLVRTRAQRSEWAALSVDVEIGDLAEMSVAELAVMLPAAGALVFAAGSNGGARAVTDMIDGDGVTKAVTAAGEAGIHRFVLVSVMPEAWRERNLPDEQEHYFAVKKRADVVVSNSDLDWVILRPALLLDDPGSGQVSLGAAQEHGDISRDDVAATIVELLREKRMGRQILEVTAGDTPIPAAVRRNVRHA